jgi:hypothetical protein
MRLGDGVSPGPPSLARLPAPKARMFYTNPPFPAGFYINLPVGGLVGLLLLFTKIPDLTTKAPFSLVLVRRTIPELDLVGFVLFAPASIMFLLALQWGNTKYPWNSSVIIGMICGAAAMALLFAVYESRIGDKAMIPGSIVRQRIVLSSAINGMGLMGVIFVASQYLPIYFQGVKGEQPAMSGVDLLPGILGQLTMVILSGTGGRSSLLDANTRFPSHSL